MYKRVAKSFRDQPISRLTGAGNWEGVVRKDKQASIVHAGRYWPKQKRFIEIVMVWPEKRDRTTELAVLRSISPQREGQTRHWRAMGLDATVPEEFALTGYEGKVGRVTWEFRRPGRPEVGLTVERIAMTRYWLKKPLDEWLKKQLPSGFRVDLEPTVNIRGHGGVELHSRQWNPLRGALGIRIRRVDLAWLCPRTERVYRVGASQRTGKAVDWPDPLLMDCCGPVELKLRQE